jgi:hypothetical protein
MYPDAKARSPSKIESSSSQNIIRSFEKIRKIQRRTNSIEKKYREISVIQLIKQRRTI